MATSGDAHERKHARKVLRLIGKGKHWVLITLLLSNVITNETLPIVLDRCLGGGWPAVVASTASIVVFGEIIPQSICVRYGLEVGAYCSPFVLILMYVMYPIAFPIAMLLDHILGEDHGTVYKKSGLKTLVTLHKTMGVERLNEDEVTIISAVLDLKEKPVGTIMTPMDRVFTMSANTILDEKTVEEIFNAGFSRIPIHVPGESMNFIGMLLVRVLISYDPEDALPVASFPLATLPETGTDTSCLNILNYFQEGKSHMIVVSSHPGEPFGALGVLTLEDVIEELIGEEIVDESDVYIDINKNIKRTQPGPLAKRNLTSYLHTLYQRSSNGSKRNSLDNTRPSMDHPPPGDGGSPVHRVISKSEYQSRGGALLSNNSSILPALDSSKTWMPINPAANPLETSKSFVTIKRPDIEGVRNSVLQSPRSTPAHDEALDGPDYGVVHTTEEGAISHQKAISNNNGNGDHKFLLPSEREADISDFQHRLSLPENGEISHQKHYRTGGIIESVINVKGVHKTIIENVSDEDRDFEFDESEDRRLLGSRKNSTLKHR
ncbi:DUF21-domain-containing protein [Yamadazyma tenuis ATCC 10573]|nr:DUF21-domain-containing protein [Yamadazyma tenuis ATCC 10573]EGV63769.1 DUF21-domain-containing protein [Yamadazyma tenuis ATCC 10573]